MRAESSEQFEEWFRRLRPAARRSVTLLLHDPDDVDDACAEAFTRAYLRWPRVSLLPYRDAWLLRVAINLALDQLKRKKTAPAAVGVSQDPSVADRVDIGRAVGALPRRQRQVVALRFLGDMPERDVAQALGLSVNTVKRHTSRALASLRGDLRAMWEESLDAN